MINSRMMYKYSVKKKKRKRRAVSPTTQHGKRKTTCRPYLFPSIPIPLTQPLSANWAFLPGWPVTSCVTAKREVPSAEQKISARYTA